MRIIRLLFQDPIEAGLIARVARGARWLDECEQAVGITVVAQLDELLGVAAGLALAP